MNVVQALAVAAAAFAISGDPLGLHLTHAEARIEAVVARGGAFAQRIVAGATAAKTDCSERGEADKHTLPDTSIHVAISSARL